MKTGLVLALIFALSALYAMVLQTTPGRLFARAKTHYSVIVGTALVVLPLGLVLSLEAWLTVVGAFVVAAVPIVARSEANDMADRERADRELHDESAD
jgi:hypothetical protein